MKVYVVVDHICEADIVVAVFSDKSHAEAWIEDHKEEMDPQVAWSRLYEGLDVVESELDPL